MSTTTSTTNSTSLLHSRKRAAPVKCGPQKKVRTGAQCALPVPDPVYVSKITLGDKKNIEETIAIAQRKLKVIKYLEKREKKLKVIKTGTPLAVAEQQDMQQWYDDVIEKVDFVTTGKDKTQNRLKYKDVYKEDEQSYVKWCEKKEKKSCRKYQFGNFMEERHEVYESRRLKWFRGLKYKQCEAQEAQEAQGEADHFIVPDHEGEVFTRAPDISEFVRQTHLAVRQHAEWEAEARRSAQHSGSGKI